MLTETMRTMYGYNRWATERVLEASTRVTPEQFLTAGGAGQGSVRDTLVHILASQQGWLAWWEGSVSVSVSVEEIFRRPLLPADYPDVAAVRSAGEALEQRTQAFVAWLSDADAARVYAHTRPDGKEWRLPLWLRLLHVVNHGTQHRSEAASMLTGFGQSPGDLDVPYFWQRGP